MPQNFTIDDTDGELVYGSGWGVASPDDPALDNYFQFTYHASRISGANVTLSFNGEAIYLFGSNGPNHGNFSVRYDNLIQFFSAQADTLSYRQLLFSNQFQPGDHSITLTNTDNSQGWLDLDYLTITGAGNTSIPSVSTSTILPLSVAPTTTQNSLSGSSLPSSSSTVQVSSQSKFNNVTLVLAIAFGILLFFLVLAVAWYLISRARRQRGNSSQSSSANPSPFVQSAGSAFLRPQSFMTPISPPPQQSALDPSYLRSPRTNFSPVTPNVSKRESGVEVRQWGTSTTPGPTSPVARSWSPFSAPFSRMFGAKDGGDSMRSTFLKV